MRNIDSLSFQEVAKLTDEDARKVLEGYRWPNGPVCPRCNGKNVVAVSGGRPGLYRCADCRRDKATKSDQFTVTVGTVFEDSHIGLSKWLQAFAIVCASKKGVSALQLQRQLGLGSYRSAWHMAHRIRHVLANTPRSPLRGIIEVDETYVGGKPRFKGQSKPGRGTRKAPVVAIVERDGGRVRAFSVQKIGGKNLKHAILDNVAFESRIMTDEFAAYKGIGKRFRGGHRTVNHSAKEYARGQVHVNSCESWFALLKRGVHGAFHHVSRQHLGRYCDEFEFRWDNRDMTDAVRTVTALKQTQGRRLMYRDLAGRTAV